MEAPHVLFEHVASRSEAELDLAVAALLVAELEYPGLDIAHYLGVLDDLAADVRRLAPSATAERTIAALNDHLFDDLQFRGNESDYYDPRNSFLNEVLDRRIGIPITLSIVYLEVGRRVGLPLEGVAFPGHFLVKLAAERGGETILDPYHGGARLTRSDLQDRIRWALGADSALAPEHLQTASKRQILVRMLNNLRGIYERTGDATRRRAIVERLEILSRTAPRAAATARPRN